MVDTRLEEGKIIAIEKKSSSQFVLESSNSHEETE